MNIFSWFFQNFIYQPQLNALQILYNLTGDVGFAIVCSAILVNLLIWPFFAASYINGQKLKILQPKLKDLQTKYKDDHGELMKQTMSFYKEHQVNNSSIYIGLVAQLFFAGGLFFLIKDVTAEKDLTNLLYPWVAALPKTHFNTDAFGLIPISAPASKYIWLLGLNSVLSFLYGMYTFKWSPQVKAVTSKPTDSAKVSKNNTKKTEEKPLIDSEAIQKSTQINTIYVFPILLFVINYSWPAGLNIYFVTVSLMSLLRQIAITRFYAARVDKLLKDIADSDPTSHEKNLDNDLEVLDGPAAMSEEPQPTLIIPAKDVSFKQKNPKNSKIKKKSK